MTLAGDVLAGGALVSSAPTKLMTHSIRLVYSVDALETSAPPEVASACSVDAPPNRTS